MTGPCYFFRDLLNTAKSVNQAIKSLFLKYYLRLMESLNFFMPFSVYIALLSILKTKRILVLTLIDHT